MLDRALKIKHAIVFLVAWIIGHAAFLIADELTLTTYYPSPYGVYNQLRTRASTYLATAAGAGDQVLLGRTAASTTARLEVNGQARIGDTFSGTDSPLVLGAVSTQSGQEYATVSSVLNLLLQASNRRVQVGTSGSSHELIVQGSVHIAAPLCTGVASAGGVTACGAGTYATFIPGLYIDSPNAGQPSMEVQLPSINGASGPVSVWVNPGAWQNYNANTVAFYCCPDPP